MVLYFLLWLCLRWLCYGCSRSKSPPKQERSRSPKQRRKPIQSVSSWCEDWWGAERSTYEEARTRSVRPLWKHHKVNIINNQDQDIILLFGSKLKLDGTYEVTLACLRESSYSLQDCWQDHSMCTVSIISNNFLILLSYKHRGWKSLLCMSISSWQR